MNGLFPIVLIALPDVPIFGGVKHWMPAMPFLAILGGEVVVLAARAVAPARAGAAAVGLSALVLLPSATAAGHFHPNGTAAYNALVGGAPGAASVGMQRQFWSNSVSTVLPWIDAHARRGARIYFHEVTYAAYRWYQREGWLRRDLRWANDPAQSDLSTYLYHQEFRDREFENLDQSRGAGAGGGLLSRRGAPGGGLRPARGHRVRPDPGPGDHRHPVGRGPTSGPLSFHVIPDLAISLGTSVPGGARVGRVGG